MSPDPFYPILPNAHWIARLVPRGLRMVQLRIKSATEAELKEQIVASQQICTAHGCLLVVNDHWRLAIECGCQAVHLGQEDLSQADVPTIKAAGLTLGVSTHDQVELRAALAAEPHYIALGPVFNTASKKVPWPEQGLEKVTQWRELVADRPLVAIGGITLESAADVLHAGADSLAVIADVTSAADPAARVDQWLAATETGRK